MTTSRKYQEAHPWIKFEIDLRRVPASLWILLGEAQSKCEHLAGVALKPEVAEWLHKVFLAKGALASTAIEGNTLTQEEAVKIVEGKLELPPSKEYLEREVQNIVKAANAIVDGSVSAHPIGLSSKLIKVFNKRVLEGLVLPDHVLPGEIRKYDIGVARYRGAPPEDCEFLLETTCKWLSDPSFEVEGARVVYGIIKAVLAHLYLAWIHPFGDGNGRTARLLEFYILINAGVPTPAAHLLSNFYNETRSEYYRQLDLASQTSGDVIPFLSYAVRGFADALRAQLSLVRRQQLDVAWVNLVHERFRDLRSRTDDRRRHLILDLSEKDEPVSIRELRRISPRITEAYAGKVLRTFTRDIEKLMSMGLLVFENRTFRPNKGLIEAFIPSRLDPKAGDRELGLPMMEHFLAPHEHDCEKCGRKFDCTCPKADSTVEEAWKMGWPTRCSRCESDALMR